MPKTASVRIIAGTWRTRRVAFPDRPALRPSGDRVRETVFNWLAPFLPGARCLDAFAGSGVLGFEALSRGAKEVTFIEKDKPSARMIAQNIDLFQAGHMADVHATDFFAHQSGFPDPFDIVFLDPPYEDGQHLLKSLKTLHQREALTKDSLIYCEYPQSLGQDFLTPHLTVFKQKSTRTLVYGLFSPLI